MKNIYSDNYFFGFVELAINLHDQHFTCMVKPNQVSLHLKTLSLGSIYLELYLNHNLKGHLILSARLFN